MKKLLLTWLLCSPIVLFAQQKIELPIASLVATGYQAENCFLWDNQVILQLAYPSIDYTKTKYYYLNEEKKVLEPLALFHEDTIISLCENLSTSFALVKRGNQNLILLHDKKVRNAWKELALPDSSLGPDVQILANEGFIVVIGYDCFFKELGKPDWNVSEYLGGDDLVQLIGNSIYGAFSGCLPRFTDFTKYDIKGTDLLEDENFDDSNFIRLQSTAVDAKGNLYLAKHYGGSPNSNFGKEQESIFIYKEGKLRPFYWYRAIPDLREKTKDEARRVRISGLCSGPNDDIYFAVDYYGIFRIRDGKVANVINTQFKVSDPSDNWDNESVGLCVKPNGDIYVAQNMLGLFAFIKNGDGYIFKQYTFKK